MPLDLRIHTTLRNEEEHAILQRDDTEFVEQLKTVVYLLDVRLDQGHVLEVEALDQVERQD